MTSHEAFNERLREPRRWHLVLGIKLGPRTPADEEESRSEGDGAATGEPPAEGPPAAEQPST